MSIKILQGDCIEMMKTLPAESVDCVVTSPPYWGLRDYGVEGQIGMERTLGEHIDVLLRVFAEIHRILKPHGSVWLNYGDCYATTPNGRAATDVKALGTDDRTFRDKPFSTIGPIYDRDFPARTVGKSGSKHAESGVNPSGRVIAGGYLKPKDLCMIPNRLAIALQEAGWWIRSEIIWGKPNAMPDSNGIRRPSTAHEKIFLLSKSGDPTCWRARDTGEWVFDTPNMAERLPVQRGNADTTPRWQGFDFYYNSDAVRLPPAEASLQRWSQDIENQKGSSRANAGGKTNGTMKAVGGKGKQRGHSRRHAGFNDRWDKMTKEEQQANGRLLRNYEPAPVEVWEIATASFSEAHFATFPPELVKRALDAGCPLGGVVFDPFGGAGTTGLVADRMGLDAILIELNPQYNEIASGRITRDNPLFAKIEVVS